MKKISFTNTWLTVLTFFSPLVLLAAAIVGNTALIIVASIPFGLTFWSQGHQDGFRSGFKKGYFHGKDARLEEDK